MNDYLHEPAYKAKVAQSARQVDEFGVRRPPQLAIQFIFSSSVGLLVKR